MRIQVAIVNESSVCTDDEVAKITAALQHQVDHDFRPTWGIAAELTAVPKGQAPLASAWVLGVLDDADQAGALGYHDLTPQLHPVGKVFAATDKKYGAEVSVTCSHELLEMLGDPYVNTSALDPNTGRLYAYEQPRTPSRPTNSATRSRASSSRTSSCRSSSTRNMPAKVSRSASKETSMSRSRSRKAATSYIWIWAISKKAGSR